MMPQKRIYRGDGLEIRRQFMCDYVFASDILEYLKSLPNGDKMHVYSCCCVSPGVFLVVFKTTENMMPFNPDRTLRITATAPTESTGGWSFATV